MTRLIAFRRGADYRLEHPGGEDWEALEAELAPQVRVARSGMGELQFYHVSHVHGELMPRALELGWCWLVAADA
jgi:hypothetical protein